VTSCSGATTCGTNGATYEECETTLNGVCQSIYYYSSTGVEYVCSSCSDCSAAASDMTSYCSSQTTTTSCSGAVTCGSNGATYEECETVSDGSCTSIYYYATTGVEYVCNSCADCSTAAADMTSYCSSQTTTTSCGSATTCGSTGVTYEECEVVADGVCSSIYYYSSNGVEYACNSCSDCTTAYDDMTSYCSSLSTTTTCGTSTACGSNGLTYEWCENETSGTCTSIYYISSNDVEYACNSCSDCTAAYDDMVSYCSTQ
jgi:hypothetical protein